MRTFDHFPAGKECPVCKTDADSQCFLMPLHGKGEGLTYEALPVHVSCLFVIGNRMFYDQENKFFYAKLGD